MSQEGLGSAKGGDSIFLTVAGGYLWNRKLGKDDPNYAEQEYEKQDKTIGVRAGAQYGDLTGRLVKVAFRTHPEYGESINVSILAAGQTYIVSIGTNNQNSQSFMKALLVMDLDKVFTMKPYDFIGNDKKRAQGISFTQDGEKLNLKVELPEEYQRDENWFKKAEKKQIKRYFEDLNEWFVAEIEKKVVPNIKAPAKTDSAKTDSAKTETKSTDKPKSEKPATEKKEEKSETKKVVKEEKPVEQTGPSILTMKKALRQYIAENYEGKELPDLSKEDLSKWYDLCQQEEELPFEEVEQEEESEDEAELSQDELENQLNGLMDDED